MVLTPSWSPESSEKKKKEEKGMEGKNGRGEEGEEKEEKGRERTFGNLRPPQTCWVKISGMGLGDSILLRVH